MLPGWSVAVLAGDGSLAGAARGVTAPGGRQAVGPATSYRLASLSKPVAGLLASVLVDEGVLAPEDEVRRWVEIESWLPPGRAQREPYNADSLVALAKKLETAGNAAEARKQAALALKLDASNETAWRMLK